MADTARHRVILKLMITDELGIPRTTAETLLETRRATCEYDWAVAGSADQTPPE